MALNLSTCLVGGIEPVLLPITNNRISVSSAASKIGVAFSIGADSQLFSAMPCMNENNTFLTHVDTCGTKNNASCTASYGGVYDPPEGVLATVDQANWNGTPISWLQQGETDGYNDMYFNDKMRIAGYDIPGLPIYTYTESANGDTGSSRLPLGVNSSFLQAAFEVEMIGTRQWSLWTGNPEENVDGLFVLGGYDKARVSGEFTAFEVDKPTQSPYIQVTGIAWEGAGQNTVNLMPNYTKSLWALPEPYTYFLYVPEESYLKFLDAANSSGKAFYNSTSTYTQFYDLPDGEIVITLNNGMKTTIPAQDLFYHPQDYNDDGVIQVVNNTYYWDRLWPEDNPGSALFFGLPFMNQKMFVADWDDGKFYMADAVKDGETATNIQPLCTSTTTVPPSPSPTPNPGPNVAAIAGGVGGGVGGLLVIALIAWFVLRKKKAAKSQATPEVSEPPHQVSSPPPKYASQAVYPVSEAPERYFSPPPQHMPQEMASPIHSPPQQRASFIQSSTRSDGTNSEYWSGQPISPASHGEKGFSAMSGPLELPAEYDERFAAGK